MAVPIYANNGGAAESNAGDPTPAYPASIAAGDLLLLQLFTRDSATASVVTPTDWTLIYGPDAGIGTSWVFAKKADGTETGTLTVDVTVAAGNLVLAIIHRVTAWYDTGTLTDAFEGGANGSGFSDTEAVQSSTSTGPDRLFVAMRRVGNPVAAGMDAYTGGNVTWTHQVDYQSTTANGGTFGCTTAPAASAITESGGTDFLDPSPVGWGNRVFAILPVGVVTPTNSPLLITLSRYG